MKGFDEEFEKIKGFFEGKVFIVEDKTLKATLACKELGYPLLAVGSTGTGKTDFFMKLAEFYGGKYEYASLNGSVTIHDLTQERILNNKGVFVERDMVLARWLRAAQEGISILHLDEVNAARPETLLALHPIMDIKGELILPYTNEILKVNKNAILVMSCNEGDEYYGVNAMNAAFENRYIKIHFDYLRGDVLAKMLQRKSGLKLDQTRAIVRVWDKYMSSRDADQPVVSIRVLERWCEMSKFLGIKQAGEIVFAGLIAKNKDDLIKFVEGDFFVNLGGINE